MKINSTQPETGFKPFTLSLDIENKTEFEILTRLFNSPVHDFASCVNQGKYGEYDRTFKSGDIGFKDDIWEYLNSKKNEFGIDFS
jgi:hypothetical protein